MYEIGYLAGIFDGEGSVNTTCRYLTIGNTDRDIIDRVCECLDVLGISYTMPNPNIVAGYRPMQRITIGKRANIQKFLDIVPVTPVKEVKIREVLESYREKWPLLPNDVNIIEERKNLSVKEIAKKYDVKESTVYFRLRRDKVVV